MKRKKLAIALSMLLSVSLLAGCGSSDSGSGDAGDLASSIVKTYEAKDMSKNPSVAKDRKDTLVIGTVAPDGVFNPIFMESAYDFYPTQLMFIPLIAADKAGEMTDGYLAEGKPEVSEDGLTYTYKIKKDANWSDGTPVTAKDVEMAIKVASDASYTGALDYRTGRVKIKGTQEYFEGKASNVSGVEVVNDKTVKFTLVEKSSSAEYVLGSTIPVNATYYETLYKQGNCDTLKATYNNPGPVTGAYNFKSYKEGEELVLVANDKSVLGAPKIKNIVYKVTTDETKVQMLQAGDIDFTDVVVGKDNVELIEGMGYAGYQMYPTNGYGYMAFNHARPQFKDKAVRQALTMGLDRAKITSASFDEYADVINVVQTKASWTYAEAKKDYKFDLEAAKKLLDDAGWKVGNDGIREKDGVKLKINFTGTSNNNVVDAILATASNNWKDLGVDFTSEKMDFNSMRAKQKGGDWDMIFMAWGLTADANNSEVYASYGGNNRTSYNNPDIDAIYTKIAGELDKEKLKELYKELYAALNEELPDIPMYQRRDMWTYNGRVKGLDNSPYVDYTYNLYKATLE